MTASLLVSLCAPVSAALYLALCWRLGEVTFFSRYSMYSSVRGRKEGAVPTSLIDGTEGEIDDCDRFSGIAIKDIYPKGIPCSLEWRVREIERWVEQHAAPAGSEPGPLKIELGFWIFRVDAGGTIQRNLRITARGRGHRRK